MDNSLISVKSANDTNNVPALPAPNKDSSFVDPNARSYNELMDVYSLHNLMVRNGKVIE